VRGTFLGARKFADLDDLNAQADAWCNGPAADRRNPDGRGGAVRDAFVEDAAHLLKLPDNPYPVIERDAVSVGRDRRHLASGVDGDRLESKDSRVNL
jgi:hypothetical protein